MVNIYHLFMARTLERMPLRESVCQREKKPSLDSRVMLTEKKVTIQISHVTLSPVQLSLSRLPESFPLDILHSILRPDVILQNCSQVDLPFLG